MNGSNFFSFLVLISVIAVPVIASQKGRRWWAWLIPTIFFGPFMLIPVLLIKEPKQKVEEDVHLNPNFFKAESKGDEAVAAVNPLPEIPKTSEGYVYVISNPSLPDNLVKIGFTDRDPSQRLKELDQAGLPTEYVEHYRIRTANPRQLEKRLHEHFASKRLREDKEFFTVTPQEVYEVLLKWGVDPLEL